MKQKEEKIELFGAERRIDIEMIGGGSYVHMVPLSNNDCIETYVKNLLCTGFYVHKGDKYTYMVPVSAIKYIESWDKG